MSTHAWTDEEGSDFGALYVVGAYLNASIAEAHHLLSAMGLWPEGEEPLALDRRQWALLASLRDLRDALEVPWDELASAWVELSSERLRARRPPRFRPKLVREPSPVGSRGELLATLARGLYADPIELAQLIDGHARFLGLDRAELTLESDAPTLRAVRRLWRMKTRLGVTVDEFLALESWLRAVAPDSDLPSRP